MTVQTEIGSASALTNTVAMVLRIQCPTVDGPFEDCVQTDLFVVASKQAA
jgi:hypothetical protein